jgi:hypothetical protein
MKTGKVDLKKEKEPLTFLTKHFNLMTKVFLQ